MKSGESSNKCNLCYSSYFSFITYFLVMWFLQFFALVTYVHYFAPDLSNYFHGLNSLWVFPQHFIGLDLTLNVASNSDEW